MVSEVEHDIKLLLSLFILEDWDRKGDANSGLANMLLSFTFEIGTVLVTLCPHSSAILLLSLLLIFENGDSMGDIVSEVEPISNYYYIIIYPKK